MLLATVRPHGVTTVRAGGMHIGLHRQVLHVVTARAEAPGLCLGQVHVDLVNLDPTLIGVETVLGGELRQGRLRRALVLLRRQRHVGTLARLVLTALAPEHRLQLDARLRERVVGYQARIGQRVQQVAAVDFLDELKHLVALAKQLVDFVLRGFVLGLLLGLGPGLVELVLALLVSFSLLDQLFKGLGQPGAQPIGLALALHEVPQSGTDDIVHVLAQQGHEAVEQPLLVLQDVVAEDGREPVLLRLLHGVQRLGGLVGKCVYIGQAGHPIVHAERKKLPAQHLGCLEEDARRRHLAGNHLFGLGEEVEVVRAVAIGQRGRHGVAITAARTAHALQEARLVRRHRAQQHRREVADVHTHLQRGGGREQVFEPGPRLLVLEALLQCLALLSVEQAGVLSRNHPAQVALAEATRPPVGGFGNELLIVGLHSVEAGHAQQALGVTPGHGQPALAARRRDEGDFSVHLQLCWVQRQCVTLVMRGSKQDARLLQGVECHPVQVSRHALGQQRLMPQRCGCPTVVPGRPAVAAQLVEVPVLAQRQKQRPRRVLAHLGHPLTSTRAFGEHPDVAITGVGNHFGVHHASPAPHVGQRSPQPLGQNLKFQSLCTELLMQAREQRRGHLLHTVPRHRHRDLADALQRPATLALVGQVAEQLPQQALAHLARQP